MAEERPDAKTLAGLKLWQALLLYPALLTTIGGAIPTAWQAYKAWRLDVAYDKVQVAEAQQKLWERNLDCLEAKPTYAVDIDDGVTVGVTLCPAGDVLLRYQVGEHVTYSWVPYPGLGYAPRRRQSDLGDVPPVVRVRLTWAGARCVQVRGGLVYGIVQHEGQVCALEHVLLATGVRVSEVAVPCEAACPQQPGGKR